MMFDVRTADLAKLNSLTKYPSILTYHVMGDKGILQDEVQIPFTGRVVGTEKVDGTNARIICCPDGGIIVGSREDLLWERRDLIGNPAMSIVETLKPVIEERKDLLCRPDSIVVYYLEVYGRNIGAGAKNYSRHGRAGGRLFDVAVLENVDELFRRSAESLAQWRDAGGQPFAVVEQTAAEAQRLGFEPVPPLFDFDASLLPTELEATNEFLLSFGSTRCKLDDDATGVPEGVVVRTPDRRQIAKIRREDYERTLKRRTNR
ncbi:MAG: RNA ligase family protein [Pirellulales bacterium]